MDELVRELEEVGDKISSANEDMVVLLQAIEGYICPFIENGTREEDADLLVGLARILRRYVDVRDSLELRHQDLWREKYDLEQQEGKDRAADLDFRRRQSAAHAAVASSVASGELVRAEKCERCGEPHDRIIAHHHDYDRPLDVEWLCPSCHGQWHAEHGRAA